MSFSINHNGVTNKYMFVSIFFNFNKQLTFSDNTLTFGSIGHHHGGDFPFCTTNVLFFSFLLAEKTANNILSNFGISKELIKSGANALKGKTDPPPNLLNSIQASYQVSGSAYEYGTSWGTKVSNIKQQC